MLNRILFTFIVIAFLATASFLTADDETDDESVRDFKMKAEFDSINEKYDNLKVECIRSSARALNDIKNSLIRLTRSYPGITLKVLEDTGLILELPTAILFASGSNFLTPSSERMLREIRQVLVDGTEDLNSYIRINLIGHTDSDKRFGDPNYQLVPRTSQNEELAYEPTYEDYGIPQYIHGKPFRALPVTGNRHVIIDVDRDPAADSWNASFEYNYLLGLGRAQVVHSYFFDTGDVESDDIFAQHRNISVTQGSYGFLQPRVSNAPVIYSSKREQMRAQRAKEPNRRVEIQIKVWLEGIEMFIEGERAHEWSELQRKRDFMIRFG